MTDLLDVNLLVALAWRSHVLHHAAQRWFGDAERGEWATATVTESGFLRLCVNARVVENAVSWSTALRMLDAVRDLPGHRWWGEDVDLASSDVVRRAPVVGHRQVSDVVLVALAARHGGRLATLDKAVVEAVHPDHRDHVVVVPPS